MNTMDDEDPVPGYTVCGPGCPNGLPHTVGKPWWSTGRLAPPTTWKFRGVTQVTLYRLKME